MTKVMISLLGGRPLPNVLAVLYLNPDHLYVVASEDSCMPNGNYDKFKSALPSKLKPESYSVAPYNLQETFNKCKEIADRHCNDYIIVVSASEPKMMSFGAYDFVKRSRERGRNIDMCYLSREGLVWIFQDKDKIEPVKIDLKSYFISYGWNVNSVETADERLEKLAPLLVKNIEIAHDLLKKLRRCDKGKGKRTNESELSDDEFILLEEIEKIGIVSNLQFSHNKVKWTISDDGAQLLLTGAWLEFYIYQVASQLKDAQGKPLFDKCGWGIKDTSGKGEIDFAGIIGGQIVIASCKTEGEIKRAWFEELHSKMEQLGKGMCSGLLISSASRKDKSMVDLDKWAKERQIILVTAEDLSRLPDILKKVIIGDRNAEPKDIPCYPRI